MSGQHASFAARVISLYLDNPDTPDMPSTTDWNIANDLANREIPFHTIQLAFQLAFIRRRNTASDKPLPPIRSLAYFRAVALNLTPEEQDPLYADYIRKLYDRLRTPQPGTTPENRTQTPKSRALS